MMPIIKKNLFNTLEIESTDHKITNKYEIFMFVLIMLNVLATMLETVKSFKDAYGSYLHFFDLFSLSVFSVDYIVRLWVCTLGKQYSSPILGRLKYMITPIMIIDLLVIIPFYLPLFIAVDTRFMLSLRMFRLARVLKLTRYSKSTKRLIRVVKSRKDDLVATLGIVAMLLVICSSLMYYVEHPAQPDKFTSIPAAMWWGIITLTTIGYGDVFPITDVGKVIGAFIALLGVGLVAIPTGIIGSGYVEELEKNKKVTCCPHCNRVLE
jgi:voltage-gated potassium channel